MEETSPLLDIFPPEIWTLILVKIKNPTELWNVITADHLFGLLCKAKEDIWIPSLVGLVFPKLYRYLAGKDILNCRRVCKRLKSSVDTYLEIGHPCRPYLNDTRFNILGKVTLQLNSLSLPYLQQMLEEMRMFPHAKIVGGAVAAIYHEHNSAERYFPFFHEIGQKILHLKLDPYPLVGTPLRLMTLIRQTLETTPNLKSLIVHLPNIKPYELRVPYRLWEDPISQFLQENPLAALPSLTSLELAKTIWSESTDSVFLSQRILEAYKGQLNKLSLTGLHGQLPPDMTLLTDLHISAKYAPILECVKNLRAPLQKVCFYFETDMVRFGNILPSLESFGSTLRDLALYGACTNDAYFESFENRQLKFPVLEKLKLVDSCFFYFTNYDFLLGMYNLRELSLTLTDFRSESASLIANGNLKLTDYLHRDGTLNESRFKECTIWNHLPKLTNVKIKRLKLERLHSFYRVVN